MLLVGCQSAPKTGNERIDALKKQLNDDAIALQQLQANEFAQLERDFIACDSMLQYMKPEAIDKAFDELQLTQAYIEQFKMTQPRIKADIDSTLYRLDCLDNDIATHYLSDSLAAVYINEETQHAELLNNQVSYFKERFSTCQKQMDAFKGKK